MFVLMVTMHPRLLVGVSCGLISLVVVLTYNSDMLPTSSLLTEGYDWKIVHHGEYFDDSPGSKVERDLHRCSPVYFQNPQSFHRSHNSSYTTLAGYFKLLESFLPPGQSFLLDYKNPCWFSTLHVRNNVSGTYPLTKILNVEALKYRTLVRYKNKTMDIGNANLTYHGEKILYCLPKFFLAGFPKTGSSSLYEYIIQHSDVTKPIVKEGHFWRVFIQDSRGNLKAKRLQILWYLKHFSLAAEYIKNHPSAVTIDASVSTLWDNADNSLAKDEDICLVPSMVASVYPQARFIVIMRDPVERLFSDFWYICPRAKMKSDLERAPQLFHNLSLAAVNNFNECVKKGVSEFECTRLANYARHHNNPCYDIRLGIGLYYFHIAKWLNVFPIEQFLFLTSEEFSNTTYASLHKVWTFMGLKPLPRSKVREQTKQQNTNWIHREQYKDKVYMLPKTAELLRKFYEPFNERLALLLGSEKYSKVWQTR